MDSTFGSLADGWHLRGSGRGRPFLIKYMLKFLTTVGEVALHFVHPGWRMGGISAVADEAAHS